MKLNAIALIKCAIILTKRNFQKLLKFSPLRRALRRADADIRVLYADTLRI